MAEAILSNVAAEIVTKLGSQLLQEMGLLWGVKDELGKLHNTVSTIQAVLLDAEEQYKASHQDQEWLGQLKKAMYAVENLLDDFSIKTMQRKALPGSKVSNEVRLFFSRSNQFVYALRLAHRIKDMRARLNEIAASRKFHLVERRLGSLVMPNDRPQTHSRPPEIVVGRDGDKEAIVELLLSNYCEENVGTIPILGIGGLGKTTLAQLVFNDERVRSQFELRLWIYVADDFDVKLIVKKIISSASKEIIVGDIEMDLVVDKLYEKINGKRYLLVLDDVWNMDLDKWSKLKDLLLGGANGSRILVTTRFGNVAKFTRPIEVYQLQGLSEAESWSLFALMAFDKGEVPSYYHKEIGEKMVAKCSGVPLVIRAIGGLLYSKATIFEWSSLANKELSMIGEGDSKFLSILKLSYYHLPPHLKHCFAYCCLFPKDHKIEVPKLINLWIAQGFVNCSSPNQCLEDVGLEYFMDLLWRSFFQEVVNDDLGNIKSCKMHGLMHDLATQVAGSESRIFDSKGEVINKKIRHVLFHFDQNSPWKLPVSLMDADDVRTFLLLNDASGVFASNNRMDERQWGVFSHRLRYLRSLDLHSADIIKVPGLINKLKHLRYLDLSFNRNIRILPNSISRLYNLQVLRLEECVSLIELPKDIHRLINLRQLDLTRSFSLQNMPHGIGHLTSLHMLTRFVIPANSYVCKHAAGLVELYGMNNLRGTLEIYNLKCATYDLKVVNLKEKQHLQCLILNWCEEDYGMCIEVEDGTRDARETRDQEALEEIEPHGNLKVLEVWQNKGLKLPKWIASLTNLVEIGLNDCTNCQYIPPLHQLPNLKKLSICHLNALEYVDLEESMQTTSSFFPSLKTLRLEECPNLTGWWRRPPTTTLQLLPRLHFLSDLTIRRCYKLALMPLFPPLKSLHFEGGSLESLKDILKATSTAEQITSLSWSSSSSSLSIALSQLQELTIECIEDLEFLPEKLLCSMCSLKALEIRDCSRLKSLGPAVGYLTSLESLQLRQCLELNLLEDEHDDHWQAFKCLRSLSLWDIPKLESLPEWLRHSQVLQTLEIGFCRNLSSVPDWMTQLTSLQRLVMEWCRLLSKRCSSKSGEDWPCIAHIPNIKVDYIVVQRNGRYLL